MAFGACHACSGPALPNALSREPATSRTRVPSPGFPEWNALQRRAELRGREARDSGPKAHPRSTSCNRPHGRAPSSRRRTGQRTKPGAWHWSGYRRSSPCRLRFSICRPRCPDGKSSARGWTHRHFANSPPSLLRNRAGPMLRNARFHTSGQDTGRFRPTWQVAEPRGCQPVRATGRNIRPRQEQAMRLSRLAGLFKRNL
jgi:hypothetical protein